MSNSMWKDQAPMQARVNDSELYSRFDAQTNWWVSKQSSDSTGEVWDWQVQDMILKKLVENRQRLKTRETRVETDIFS